MDHMNGLSIRKHRVSWWRREIGKNLMSGWSFHLVLMHSNRRHKKLPPSLQNVSSI